MLKDYDVIGFEASHALVKWNIDAMTKHTLEVFLNDLVLVLGYPVEARMVDFDKLLPLYLNNAVWDIDTGLMLKLGVEREIMHAGRGYEKCCQEELVFKYGDPPTYRYLRWPVTN